MHRVTSQNQRSRANPRQSKIRSQYARKGGSVESKKIGLVDADLLDKGTRHYSSMVEQLSCKQQVFGSNPNGGSTMKNHLNIKEQLDIFMEV